MAYLLNIKQIVRFILLAAFVLCGLFSCVLIHKNKSVSDKLFLTGFVAFFIYAILGISGK